MPQASTKANGDRGPHVADERPESGDPRSPHPVTGRDWYAADREPPDLITSVEEEDEEEESEQCAGDDLARRGGGGERAAGDPILAVLQEVQDVGTRTAHLPGSRSSGPSINHSLVRSTVALTSSTSCGTPRMNSRTTKVMTPAMNPSASRMLRSTARDLGTPRRSRASTAGTSIAAIRIASATGTSTSSNSTKSLAAT